MEEGELALSRDERSTELLALSSRDVGLPVLLDAARFYPPPSV